MRTWRIIAVVLLMGLIPISVHAGVFGKAGAWITGEVAALIASGIMVLLAGVFGVLFRKVTRTFKETGEFLTTLGTALEDQRLSREELAAVIKEGGDIFKLWR